MTAYVATAFPGLGTLVNVATVIVGSSIGLLLGRGFPHVLGTLSRMLSGW